MFYSSLRRVKASFFATLTSVLTLTLLVCAAAPHPAQASAKTLTDFSPQAVAQTWSAVNDSVMGGVSKGSIAVSSTGTLIFSGTLSLENNGGFASIRSRDGDLDLDGCDTLAVRVKGDGRSYYLSLRTPDRRMASSYRAPIQTMAGQWTEVRLPLKDFYYTSFGRRIERAPIQASQINSLGFTLSDKKPGGFYLEIDWIKAIDSSADVSDTTYQAAVRAQVGDRSEASSGNLVQVATAAGQFKTLLAAAKAAGLVETLTDPDAQLTVFAPTDEAFAKLPEGTVQSLLRPSNREALRAVLANHVVKGKIQLGQSINTLQGQTLALSIDKARIGDASILAANVQASNGVIHVIDSVLVPEMPKADKTQRAMRVIELAIERGVPIYNAGQPAACAAIYEVTAASLLSGHRDALTDADAKRLQRTLDRLGNHTASDQAWALREALDEVYASLIHSGE